MRGEDFFSTGTSSEHHSFRNPDTELRLEASSARVNNMAIDRYRRDDVERRFHSMSETHDQIRAQVLANHVKQS